MMTPVRMPSGRSAAALAVAVLLMLGLLAAPATAAAPTTTGAITGKVLSDPTATTPSAPLVGIEVDLYLKTSDGCGEFYWDYQETVETMAGGAYSFGSLAPGDYRIGYNGDRDHLDEYYDDATDLDAATTVAVGAASVAVKDAKLASRGTITGNVSPASAGSAGISGVDVTLYEYFDGDEDFPGGWGPIDSTTTNTSGNYSLTGILPGTYRVGFSGQASYASEFHRNAVTVETATDVQVTLNSAPITVDADLAPARHVTGTVTSTAIPPLLGIIGGTPAVNLPGITVSATRVGTSQYDVSETETAANGTYDLGGLSSGQYVIRFSDPTGKWRTEYHADVTTEAAATPVDTSAAQSTALGTTALITGSHLTGSVGATGTNAPGLADVYVTAYRNVGTTNAPEWEVATEATTGSNGTYDLGGLAAGTYRVGFEPTSDHFGEFYDNKATIEEATDVTVTAGASVDVGTTRSLGNAELAKAASVTGRVTAADDGTKNLQDIDVTLYDSTKEYVDDVYTDATGHYDLGGLTPGTYYLGFDDAYSGTYRSEFFNNAAQLSSATPIVLSSGSTKQADAELAEISQGAVENLTPPVISGTPQVGSTLQATTGTWSPADTGAFTYQWYSNCVEITGATTNSYTPTAADAGHQLFVEVTGNARGLTSTPAYSDSTVALPSVVVNTALPTVTGTPEVGQTLVAGDGTWSPTGTTQSRQWLRGTTPADAVPIPGATGASYVLGADDLGKKISVRITRAATGVGDGTATSLQTLAVTSPTAARVVNVVAPSVIGQPAIGRLLGSSPGVWSTPGVTFARQWLVGGVPVAGETGTSYVVRPADAGRTISLRVTGSKTGLVSGVATSAPTAVVPFGRLTALKGPKITGTAKVGKRLKANAGTWSPAGVTFGYQWLRNGKVIRGATSSTYKLTKASKGKRISVRVTARKQGHTTRVKTTSKTAKVKGA